MKNEHPDAALRPTVSVVIPCYNAARFLRETISSALRQTHPPLEVIVVDDGSKDDSSAIAKSFGPPVRVISQENQGESVARNRGIDEATGDWVALLDADDIWMPTKLARQIDVIEDDVLMIHTSWFDFGAKSGIYDLTQVPVVKRYDVERICNVFNPFNGSSTMFPRSLPIRFPTWTRHGEDICFYMDVALDGRIVLAPELLVGRRMHAGSQSADPAIRVRWHQTLCEWLKLNAHRVNESTAQRIRERSEENLVEVAEACYWKRDWDQMNAIRAYLKQFSALPAVARHLGRRVLPPVFYRVKDWIDACRHGKASGHGQSASMIIELPK